MAKDDPGTPPPRTFKPLPTFRGPPWRKMSKLFWGPLGWSSIWAVAFGLPSCKERSADGLLFGTPFRDYKGGILFVLYYIYTSTIYYTALSRAVAVYMGEGGNPHLEGVQKAGVLDDTTESPPVLRRPGLQNVQQTLRHGGRWGVGG